MMKIAIMQPYFFPYIGYFQLLNHVDTFVVYDDIEYTKKGWINRNRILQNGQPATITIPIKKDSDFLAVNQRYVSDSWNKERKKLLNKIREAYRKAPYSSQVLPMVEECINYDDPNLFQFVFHSIEAVCDYLDIQTQLIKSSSIEYNQELKGQEKVIAICKSLGAKKYVNPIGGVELYDKQDFADQAIDLSFLGAKNIPYPQFDHEFVPFLSIMDVLMFNEKDVVMEYLQTGFHLN